MFLAEVPEVQRVLGGRLPRMVRECQEASMAGAGEREAAVVGELI